MLQTTTGPESFTVDERGRLGPYFSNLDSHGFALTNLLVLSGLVGRLFNGTASRRIKATLEAIDSEIQS